MKECIDWLDSSVIPKNGIKILCYNDRHGYVIERVLYHPETDTVTLTDSFNNKYSLIWKNILWVPLRKRKI